MNDFNSELKSIKGKISEIEDILSITQLDIVNLKNSIDEIKLLVTPEIPEEVNKRIMEIEDIIKHTDAIKRWERTVDEVKFLREKILSLNQKIAKKELKSTALDSKKIKSMENSIRNLTKELEDVRNSVYELKKKGIKELFPEFKRRTNELKEMISKSNAGIVLDKLKEMDKLKSKLELELKRVEKYEEYIKSIVAESKKTKERPCKQSEDIQKRLSEMEKMLVGMRDEMDSIKKRINEPGEEAGNKVIKSLASKLNRLEDRINEIERVREELEDMLNKVYERVGDVEKLKSELARIKKDMKGLGKEEVKELLGMVEGLEKRLSDMEGVEKGLLDMKDYMQSLSNMLAKEREKVDKLEGKIKAVSREKEENFVKCVDKSVIENIRSEIKDEFEKINENIGEWVNSIGQDIARLKVDVNNIKMLIDMYKKEEQELAKRLDREFVNKETIINITHEIGQIEEKLNEIEMKLSQLKFSTPFVIE